MWDMSVRALKASRFRVEGKEEGERAQQQHTDRPAERPEPLEQQECQIEHVVNGAIEQARNDAPLDRGKDREEDPDGDGGRPHAARGKRQRVRHLEQPHLASEREYWRGVLCGARP